VTPPVGHGDVYRGVTLARTVAAVMLVIVLATLRQVHRRASAAEQRPATVPFPKLAAHSTSNRHAA
jgi:hypothetical protein